MISDDRATGNEAAFCLAKKEEIYAVYLPNGGKPTRINLPNSGKTFSVRWYDPRNGGDLQKGSVLSVVATGKKDVGLPPSEQHQDWVVLVQKTD
jgi:hypothetical protein